MANEYQLSYTGAQINKKLGKIDSLAEKSEVPTKVSELTNDSGFITGQMRQDLTEEQKVQARENIGAVKSWNDLTDRPFWAEEPVTTTEVTLEETFELTEGLVIITGHQYNFVDGAECIITYDGAEYTGTVIYNNTDESFYLGNLALLGFDVEDNGQPFAVGYLPSENIVMIMGTDMTPSITHTIKIVSTYDYEEIHKLDSKFIDMDWMASKKVSDVEILSETTMSMINPGFADGWFMAGTTSPLLCSNIKTINITIDGVEYTDVPGIQLDAEFVFGDLSALGYLMDANWPFIVILHDYNVNVMTPISGDHTVQINGKQTVYNRLPNNYLPKTFFSTGDYTRPVYCDAWGNP